MRESTGNSVDSPGDRPRQQRAHGRGCRFTAVAALILITLGNATGLLRELHHEHAGHDHNDHDCPICQVIATIAKCALDPPAEVPHTREAAWHNAQLPTDTLHPQSTPLAIQPRGPPTTPALNA